MYNVIKEQHRQLGSMSFGELSVLGLFSCLVVLWFTRDPGFVAGWATYIFNTDAEYGCLLFINTTLYMHSILHTPSMLSKWHPIPFIVHCF